MIFKIRDTISLIAPIKGGILGTGTGPEYTDPNYEGEGQYIPIAIPLAKLEEIELIPSVIKSLIIDKYLNEKHSK